MSHNLTVPRKAFKANDWSASFIYFLKRAILDSVNKEKCQYKYFLDQASPKELNEVGIGGGRLKLSGCPHHRDATPILIQYDSANTVDAYWKIVRSMINIYMIHISLIQN